MPRRRRRRPVGGEPTARKVVEAELRAAWRCDPADIEGLAEDTHVRAFAEVYFPTPRVIAERLGYTITDEHRGGCGQASLFGDELFVRPSADRKRLGLRILHELAHDLMDRHYPRHSHADVWALTLALALPRSLRRLHPLQVHVPRWAVALRLRVVWYLAKAA